MREKKTDIEKKRSIIYIFTPLREREILYVVHHLYGVEGGMGHVLM